MKKEKSKNMKTKEKESLAEIEERYKNNLPSHKLLIGNRAKLLSIRLKKSRLNAKAEGESKITFEEAPPHITSECYKKIFGITDKKPVKDLTQKILEILSLPKSKLTKQKEELKELVSYTRVKANDDKEAHFISKKSLMDFEDTEKKAASNMKLSTLCMLAEAYDVSPSYLLGEINYEQMGNHDAQKELGLTLPAIEAIKSLPSKDKATLSYLLENMTENNLIFKMTDFISIPNQIQDEEIIDYALQDRGFEKPYDEIRKILKITYKASEAARISVGNGLLFSIIDQLVNILEYKKNGLHYAQEFKKTISRGSNIYVCLESDQSKEAQDLLKKINKNIENRKKYKT